MFSFVFATGEKFFARLEPMRTVGTIVFRRIAFRYSPQRMQARPRDGKRCGRMRSWCAPVAHLFRLALRPRR
jgi:hypothetical protein